ncbi:hypothetical protein C4J81_12110 [Deltaproteobacteria bacterium Smac51]|nr:hypothetical protein C4J81_12110 [Deltaproteobacteria bacterium Smac51]
MKIGAIARKLNIPVDNIYFYIKSGLIVPPKKGQYIFDENTVKDLETLVELKEMEFPLKDIHRILSLLRVSRLEDQRDIDDLKILYAGQAQRLEQRIGRLVTALDRLRAKESELDVLTTEAPAPKGLPLSTLALLCCPLCRGNLDLNEVRMSQDSIYSGRLTCLCGYAAAIEDGILLTPNRNQSLYDRPEITRNLYKDLPSQLISMFQKSYNWMSERLIKTGTRGRVVLETYVNAWFFLHNHQHVLDRDCRLIVIDKFPETLKFFKQLIDRQKHGLDILYIADSGLTPPLKFETVDINIDFFATNEHNFYHHTFWPDHLRPYLKPGAQLIGTYFYFDGGYKSINRLLREYPESYRRNFNRKYFMESMDNHYQIKEVEDLGYILDSGENLGFSFHVKGEKMHLMPYQASADLKRGH